MRFTILEKIKSETRLARLFNAYMEGLSTLEIVSTPRESMRACWVAFAEAERSNVPALSIVGQAQRYYSLTVALVKSLVQKLIGELVNRPFYRRTATDSALSPQKTYL